ncbi:CRAL-TRIO domain-containing protein [Gaertneriomyces semiglobifer]|nr:CRAL-TRIO domain-containing protein [Gaertneriomyces semiglobifer]
MTSKDPGHIENLSAEQSTLLKDFWLELFSAIDAFTPASSSSGKGSKKSQTNSGSVGELKPEDAPKRLVEELFLACAFDAPDQFMLRFLRARKWDVTKAVQMCISTLQWRIETDIRGVLTKGEEGLDPAELECNKSYFMGTDLQGRPCCFVHVRLHDKGTVNQILTRNLTIYLLETGRLLLQAPQEMAMIVFDMTGFGLKNMDYDFLKFLLACMQGYYPESLGACLVVGAPWIFNGCWQVIKPWLDPIVASKVHFVKAADLPQYIPAANIPSILGGEHADFEFSFASPADLEARKQVQSDLSGKENAEKRFFDVISRYRPATEALAKGEGNASEVESQRQSLETELAEAYLELSKFIRTRTIYHRLGWIENDI